MPCLTDLSLKVHPVLLMTPGRQGQSGVVSTDRVVNGK